MLLLITSIVFLVIASIYFVLTQKFKYFSKHGIPGPKTHFPYGNTKDAFWGKRNVIYDIDDIYRHFKGKSPFVGFFMTFTPYYLIMEPDLVKKIFINDFGKFRNNDFNGLASKKKDPLMYFNPFLLTDELWKEKRAEVTPSMSQNKLKSLYPLVIDVTKKLTEYIRDEQSPLDARDLCSRYTCDATANCLFGIDALSLTLENAELYEHSRKIMKQMFGAVTSIFPRRMFPKDSEKFFIKLVKDAIKYRAENNIEREDFLSQVIASQKKKDLPEIEVFAQAWTYYMDSFETAAIGLHFILYELAKNKRVQDKLRDEILSYIDGSDLTFEKLLELEYLDQVMYEALRIHPPLTYTTRICSENYELEGAKGHKFTLIEKI
ncbi:hypothetical protein PVAND_010702 [Polypedilum vanderplanki]|uniref:Cytochrome P450 n=1 Tax=Polypedilum vanderplanki TaxID=319348 RepID=A0A9J6CHM4_POLVA|nr:hypothetical protein PVAND_010702 [Polypedilum vanderplanki]